MLWRWIPILLAAVLASGCDALTPAAALVNGQKVTEAEVQQEVDRVRDDQQFQELLRRQGEEVRGQYRRNVLTAFIRVVVIAQEARRRGIRVGPRDVDAYLADLERRVGGPQRLREALRQANLSLQRARELARRQILEDRLSRAVTRGLTVSDEEIARAYEQRKALFSEVHLARITVPTLQEAQGLVEQLNHGADFAALARERSKDPAAAQGGDLGFTDSANLDPALATQLEGVEPGGIVGPLRGAQGYEVYRLLERRPIPLERVRGEIADQLLSQRRRQAFESWLAGRMRRARVVINPRYGRFDRARLRVVPGPATLRE